MPSTLPSPQQRAAAEALAQAIAEAVAVEIGQIADTLLATDDRQVFGQTEFAVRALAHRIAAKAYEQHLARKKTATTGPA
jgi:prolyl-tRNA editing enzyme YbaK/EbsC (Cys-tRNA(Pro) deacylase)